MLDLKDQFGCFLDTFNNSSSDLLDKSDDDLEYALFEGYLPTFLYEETFERLLKADLINAEIVQLCLEFREKMDFIQYADEDKRLAKYVRSDKRWRDVLQMSSNIREIIVKRLRKKHPEWVTRMKL